jgi:hypothetical protein
MKQQFLILPETVLGLDKRGQFVRYSDFQKNYEVLKTIVQLNSRGKEIAKKAKFYKINRMRKTNEK